MGVMTSQNDTKLTITRKIKIGKIFNLVFLSIRLIADLSCKFQKCSFISIIRYLFVNLGIRIFEENNFKKILKRLNL